MKLLLAVAACATAALCACTGSSTPPPVVTTQTQTVTHTRAPTPPPVTAVPAATVDPVPYGQNPPKGEVTGNCPYISSDINDPNGIEQLEGDRVYLTVVLTDMKPVGCRFYFWAPPYEAIADIVTHQYPNSTDAYDAMVLTGDKGTAAAGVPVLRPGVKAVLFRTDFFGPDGKTDWACAFAKGSLLVIVHTQRNDDSEEAQAIAAWVEPKI